MALKIIEASQEDLAPKEIIDHITELHVETDSDWWENVEGQIHRHYSWVLCRVEISSIPDLAYAPAYQDVVDDYRLLNTDPPPIVIDDNGAIIDGVHRAKSCNSKDIAAYLPSFLLEKK